MTAPFPEPGDTGLPIEAAVGEVRAALADHRRAVVTASPGAGKTTVLPLRLAGEAWLGGARIVVLEPRRVAARAAARRMAALTGTDVGDVVGYRTRDERRVGPRTRVEVVTEGVLTRRLQRDPELRGVGLVVFDEFHERSLTADLGLALTLDVRRGLRPDLAILVMSATLDVDRVAAHLDGAPVVDSPGRQHPVEVRWVPRGRDERLDAAMTNAVLRAVRDEPGDVLAFLPGAGEIRRVAQNLQIEGADDRADVRPLFGALAAAEQDAALAPSPTGRRKIVLATDIAETSLTVEGVRVVVDAGLARVPRFDARTGMTRLATVTASKASADQRAGRAGREQPGVAYRLWSKMEHAARRPSLDPEILSVELAGLALELAAWGTAAGDLPFLDQPPVRALGEARALLVDLGALDERGSLTEAGRRMVELPLHPRLARMVTRGEEQGRGWLACVLAALVDDRDILRGRPDDLPADVATRLDAFVGVHVPASADRGAVGRSRATAEDLARRAGVEGRSFDPDDAGAVLALGFPDRIAQRRGGPTPGRFRLRGGAGAWVRPHDPLAAAAFVVAADLDGNRKDARIRLGAPVDAGDLAAELGASITEHAAVVWDRERDELVARAERSLGQLRLGSVDRPATPGPRTEKLLRQRLREEGAGVLAWSAAAARLRSRIAFVAKHRADWPDVDDRSLLAAVDLTGVASWREVRAIDPLPLLWDVVGPGRRDLLERLAPERVRLGSGRFVDVDYDSDPPAVASRVQDFFGQTSTPRVLDGELRVVVLLLSPAGRPVQVTSDLEHFWSGSWREVRREMAGRYPKHDWPEVPPG